jgi:hypothetical protein
MSKIRLMLVVLGDAMLIIALIFWLQIDQIVNGTLYHYGLQFSDAWAQPYWLMLRLSLVLIVVAIVMITLVELPMPAFEKEENPTN